MINGPKIKKLKNLMKKNLDVENDEKQFRRKVKIRVRKPFFLIFALMKFPDYSKIFSEFFFGVRQFFGEFWIVE